MFYRQMNFQTGHKASYMEINFNFIKICLASIIMLSACTTAPKYQGPVVTIWDNATQLSTTKAYYYQLVAVDGHHVTTSSETARKRMFVLGNELVPIPIAHNIPLHSTLLTIGGYRYNALYNALNIFGLGDTIYDMKGKILVNLDATKSYVVNGKHTNDYSLIWLEENKTGIIVSPIISQGNISARQLSDFRQEKIRKWKQNVLQQKIKQKQQSKLLDEAIVFIENQGCEQNSKTNNTKIYNTAVILFKNKKYNDSLRCFLKISNTSDTPYDKYKYLSMIYDVGLGVEEDPEKSAYWYDKYKEIDMSLKMQSN